MANNTYTYWINSTILITSLLEPIAEFTDTIGPKPSDKVVILSLLNVRISIMNFLAYLKKYKSLGNIDPIIPILPAHELLKHHK
ncbi:hypothetical protein Hanom_Chr09g00852461 [Helianthus anomalus]